MAGESVLKTGSDAGFPFDPESKLKDWILLAELNSEDPTEGRAIVLEAPDDSETSKPYAFLYYNRKSDQILEIVDSTVFTLAIAVAHRWSTTSDLEEIPEHTMAEFVVVMSQTSALPGLAERLAAATTTLGIGS